MKKYTKKSMESALILDKDLEIKFEEMLDDCYAEIDICGLKYSPSNALKSVDPIAFNCGFSDYVSQEIDETIIEIDGEYYDIDLLEEIEEIEGAGND